MRARRPLLKPPAVLAAVAAGLVVLAGCGSGGGSSAPSPTPAAPTTYGPSTGAGEQYVALGDSYTAGAALKPQVGGDDCLRSQINYPHLLVKQVRGLALDDVSCSGATTESVLQDQVGALSESTKLVTIGIGGNDGGLFATLIGGCLQLRSSDPTGDPCEKAGGGLAQRDLAAIRTADDALVADVAKRAPGAKIVVVGYPQPLPSSGTCPAIAPIATGDYAFVNRVVAGLSDDLRAAASAHGAQFVDVARASLGHDLCSKHPWINGQSTSSTGAIPFHPLPAEQAAVASMIARLLS